MKTNIGNLDRAIRAVAGLAILAVTYHTRSTWGVIGLAPVLTAYFGFCPLYQWLHIDTCHAHKE